ncbi:MAG TPA: PPC domain-containing protein [Thermoanaerobaculia bacterium]|nr:PPC domain-containing protein [Thermoanaerobaculia bacterium]
MLFAFLVASPALADCGDTLTLSCNGAANALTSSDCTSFDGTRYDTWTFNGTSGETVTMQMTSTAFDTFVALLDPSGFPVAQNDDTSSTSTDSRVTFTLTATGTWTIVANALNAGGTGDYFVSLTCPSNTTGRRRAVGH